MNLESFANTRDNKAFHRRRESGRIPMDNHVLRPGDCGRYVGPS